jgi:hypothetical protein
MVDRNDVNQVLAVIDELPTLILIELPQFVVIFVMDWPDHS